MDYAQYDTILLQRMLVFGVVSLALSGIWFAFVIKDRKQRMTIHKLFCIVMCLVCFLFGAIEVYKHNYDMQNDAYLVWEGEYTIDNHGGTTCFVYLPDKDGIKLEAENLGIDGTYYGKVIYSEKSKIALEYYSD